MSESFGVNITTTAGTFTVTQIEDTCVDIIGPVSPTSQLISPQEAHQLAQALSSAAMAVVANQDGAA